jgi:serine/threonine protein kinase
MNHTSRVGMQPWMAPEILLAPTSTARYDHTCDIYSSATVLFCLGSGRPPPRISPSAPKERGDLGLLDWPELASIIERMWEHDPAYRSVFHP